MVDKESQGRGDQDTKDVSSKAVRAARREARNAKRAGSTNKGAKARPTRLCTLGTIEVKKDTKGYQIIAGGEKRHAINIATDQVGAVLKDLEAAFYVIRADAGITSV